MELPVSAQGLGFLHAGLLGIAMAAVYDLLRGPRRLLPRWTTWFWDLLFCAALFWSLLWFLLVPADGLIRLYHVVGLLLGALLWFRLVTPWLLRGWLQLLHGLFRGIRLLFQPFVDFLKFLRKIVKKCFL